jgi:hypothetical protein
MERRGTVTVQPAQVPGSGPVEEIPQPNDARARGER